MKNVRSFVALLLCLLSVAVAEAQQLKLGKQPTTMVKSALLELNTDNQGLLMPRLNDTVTINSLNPPDGMMIYFIPMQRLLVRVNGSWQIVTTGPLSGMGWSVSGNSGTSSSNFLGTIDDKAMIIRSNNTNYLEFGRRQTLGLTQGYTDYDNNDEAVLHIKSALQFFAPNASFYKPKMYTDVNGNFRVKGSSAGTDYFEFGSTGTNNNGGFEFVIGDDGDEPIVFKSYHYVNGMSEIMRLQSGRMAVGSNAFNASNPEKLLIDAGATTSYNLMTGKGSIDNYLQINVQNRSNGANASSDIVATSDNGDENTHYIDMGINSSAYTNNTWPMINGINNAYLYATGNDFIIGNGSSGKNFRLFTGGMALTNERLRVDGTGNIGINNTAPAEKLDVNGNIRFSGALMPGNNAGTSGFVLQSSGPGVPPVWVNASTVFNNAAWTLDGNTMTSIKKFGTTNNYDIPFITNNTERMRLTTAGYLGFNTTLPQGRLHAVSDNTETGDDYIFDDYGAGVTQGFFIRKARGTVSAPQNLVSGDHIGAIHFSGRVSGAFGLNSGSGIDAYYKGSGSNDLTDLRLITSNTERMRIDEAGNVGIGSSTFDATNPEALLIDAGTTSSVNALFAKGSVNEYFQINIKNLSSGNQASSDLVATANNGTETTGFVNLGINGSGFVYQAGNPIETGKANDGYLISAGNDFYVVNNNTAKDIIFMAGGTAPANEAMRITSTERIGIGTTAPTTLLHVKTGVTDDAGLRLENLTSNSATTAGAAPIGVDATGKIVRTKQPVYYSGTGTTASTETVTKVWVAQVANTNTGIVTVTIPSNVAFSTILNIQVTARGGSSVTTAPFATITSNTATNITLRILESKTTASGSSEGLEPHTDTSTAIFIRVEGN